MNECCTYIVQHCIFTFVLMLMFMVMLMFVFMFVLVFVFNVIVFGTHITQYLHFNDACRSVSFSGSCTFVRSSDSADHDKAPQ